MKQCKDRHLPYKYEAFKYWLRINGHRLSQFGTGEKNSPIKNIRKLITT